MQPISRRTLLSGAGVTAVAAVAACSDGKSTNPTSPTGASTSPAETSTTAPATTIAATTTTPEVELPGDPFTLGVASGDPDATSVVLWTRLAPDPLDGGGMPDIDVAVQWEVSATSGFAVVAATGTETATATHGHSVHAVVELEPGFWYYRFRAGGYTSAVGVTRVAPATDVAVYSATFAVGSCQNYSHGYYAAHRDIAEQQPDFLVWLGDYIYEGAEAPDDGTGRTHLGPEPTTVVEYRNRYGLYKSDPDLQQAHATCPWFVVWDDHEVENNYAGLMPQVAADAPGFAERRFAAYQAWWEHQPVRLPPPTSADEDYRIYRSAQWGDLIQLVLLDGRQYRSDQACGDVTLSTDPPCAEAFEPSRTMLGSEQEEWLIDTLQQSAAGWNVVGNQVVLADATLNGAVLNYDQWDGYPVERRRVLERMAGAAIDNLVVVTGDIHLAAAATLTIVDDDVRTPVGVEFVTTSISSNGNVEEALADVLRTFPDLVDAELAHRGYCLHRVTPERWTAEYRIVDDVDDPASEVTVYGTFTVDAGSNDIVKR